MVVEVIVMAVVVLVVVVGEGGDRPCHRRHRRVREGGWEGGVCVCER